MQPLSELEKALLLRRQLETGRTPLFWRGGRAEGRIQGTIWLSLLLIWKASEWFLTPGPAFGCYCPQEDRGPALSSLEVFRLPMVGFVIL